MFLEIESPDYNDYISIYNKEFINNNNNNDIYNNDELSLFIILKQAKICRTVNKEIINQNNNDLNELNFNYRYIKSNKSLRLNINII
jgi:hypothetical protein